LRCYYSLGDNDQIEVYQYRENHPIYRTILYG